MSDINKRIAVEVMGWLLSSPICPTEIVNDRWVAGKATIKIKDWNPDTDMNDAFMVVDKMQFAQIGISFQVAKIPFETTRDDCWCCYIKDSEDNEYEAIADTPPMAICLAALKVKEGE